jgi:guanylate kinase
MGEESDAGRALTHPERVFILSGPSGVGKNTLAEKLCRLGKAVRVVTATTRPPRPGEVDGRDYHFMSKDEFVRQADQGRLLEYVTYVGNCYGTPAASVNKAAETGLPVLLVIDVDGARQLKARWPEVTLMFVLPPSREELKRRLESRGQDRPGAVSQRLQRALQECERADGYDFQVVNDRVERTVEQIAAIMKGAPTPETTDT